MSRAPMTDVGFVEFAHDEFLASEHMRYEAVRAASAQIDARDPGDGAAYDATTGSTARAQCAG
jgi:hypothetical protein